MKVSAGECLRPPCFEPLPGLVGVACRAAPVPAAVVDIHVLVAVWAMVEVSAHCRSAAADDVVNRLSMRRRHCPGVFGEVIGTEASEDVGEFEVHRRLSPEQVVGEILHFPAQVLSEWLGDVEIGLRGFGVFVAKKNLDGRRGM